MAALSAFHGAPEARAVDPTHDEAREFGQKLQTEFEDQKHETLVQHLDQTALFQRIFSSFGQQSLTDPAAKNIFEKQFLPSLLADMATMSEARSLILSRVMLMGDARYLEVVLLEDNDSFRVLMLRLSRKPDGSIGISDITFHGATLEYSLLIRDALIVLGAPLAGGLGEEGMTLVYRKSMLMPVLNQMAYESARGDQEAAFTQWLRAPEDVQKTRFWRNWRTRLVMLGSVAALNHLQSAIADGSETNPMLRLSFAKDIHTPEARLELLEDALGKTWEMPFLRTAKASALLELDRIPEALQIASEALALAPYNVSAYLVGIKAHVMSGKPEEGVKLMQSMNRFLSAGEIQELLELDPELSDFLRSAEYTAWRSTAAEEILPQAT
ncbi:MAG: hypothetical protein R3F03_02680 [Opitutaceae bacterium]